MAVILCYFTEFRSFEANHVRVVEDGSIIIIRNLYNAHIVKH